MSVVALRTLIVDDEAIARERMRMQCAGVDGLEVVGMASDGGAALTEIDALAVDLLLLDIAMPGLGGMAVAQEVQRSARRPAVVFCTASDRDAIAAFEVSAVDYLLKPVSRERLARAIDKVRRSRAAIDAPLRRRWMDELWAPHRGAMLRVAVADLEWIEAERDYVRLWTKSASYLLHDTLTRIEQKLDPAVFVRLRRSTVVRRASILSLRHEGAGAWSAVMLGGATLRIGPTYLQDLKASLKVRP